MSQKKTIQLANGLAEEGDRVSDLSEFVSGNIGFNNRGEPIFIRDGGDVFPIVEEEDVYYPETLCSKDMVILFGPTDALEAVGEVRNKLKEDYGGIELVEFKQFSEELISRIQQKRKDHD